MRFIINYDNGILLHAGIGANCNILFTQWGGASRDSTGMADPKIHEYWSAWKTFDALYQVAGFAVY